MGDSAVVCARERLTAAGKQLDDGGARVRVDCRELLRFYDDPQPGERGMTATAVNAVAGEELGLALLLHYFANSGVAAVHLAGPCTTGKVRGPRLDAWVQTPEVLYQVEVKNWSSHSFAGTRFPLAASEDIACAHRKAIWAEYWNGSTFVDAPAAKVLVPMKPPVENARVEPLIAFWVALHPKGSASPFFSIPLEGKSFDRVSVFSMSTYLRSLDSGSLDLELPQTHMRLDVLGRIFGESGRA